VGFSGVRDAAIILSTIVDLYVEDPSSPRASNYTKILDAYAHLQSILQHTTNPSGSFEDGLSGLGEAKFNADGSAFTGSWGRPQRDGPALRAIALMGYLRAYNTSNPHIWATSSGQEWYAQLYKAEVPAKSVIKADLEYVSRYWNSSGFDLWEEVYGLHFFTAMVQLRALKEGSDLAYAFGDEAAAEWYKIQAEVLEEELIPRFWDEGKGHLVETLGSDRSGLDCALLLGSLLGVPSSPTHKPIHPPHSDEILVSLLYFVQDQRKRFPINANSESEEEDDGLVLEGTGLGRYPEDVYDGYATVHTKGGNPWFLCTSSAAEVLFKTASHLATSSSLKITPLALPFYTTLLASSSLDVNEGTYTPSDALFHSVIENLVELGDDFLRVVKIHKGAKGDMSEQFDRTTGYMRGAHDLTWSYGAFIQASRARKGTKGL
jgi:glucoamylase